MAAPPESDDPARRLAEALTAAEVGSADLFAGLSSIGGFGPVSVADGVGTVEVTLPVPAAEIRDRIEHELRATAADVDGVDDLSVRWRPRAADPGAHVEFIPDVRNVVAVSSGKGGVGKSTVAVNVAAALADAGAAVGLLDADVYGPNAATMLGLSDTTPNTTLEDRIVPREAHGVRVMSMSFIVAEDDPVIWRGPMVDDMLKQLFGDVQWGALDYLIVDMPPGTGDAQVTLSQHLPVTGAVVVTTPQSVAVDDARRSVRQFARYDVPVLGVAENMSAFACPDCETVTDIFGTGGGRALAEEFDLPLLGQVPLDPAVGEREREDAPAERGVRLPLVGRLTLPRTQEERELGGVRPPMALREDDSEVTASLRSTATRIAARVNAAAISHGT